MSWIALDVNVYYVARCGLSKRWDIKKTKTQLLATFEDRTKLYMWNVDEVIPRQDSSASIRPPQFLSRRIISSLIYIYTYDHKLSLL